MNEDILYEPEETMSDTDPCYEENKLEHVLGELREHCEKYHLPFLKHKQTYEKFEATIN